VPDGGWFPLLIGRRLHLAHHLGEGPQADDRADERGRDADGVFIKSAVPQRTRVPGTAVFMTASAEGVPHALLHNLKHNKVLHERVFLLTVRIEDVPYVAGGERYSS
jgi:KUP system potassium uptake protein